MPKSNEAKFGKYFNLPNPGLESYFGNVVRGQPDEYRTTFYKNHHKTVEQVLSDWMSFLETHLTEWPGLLKYEKDLAKKVGPMSIMKPLKDRMEDIDSYYDSILKESKPIPQYALNLVSREWSSHRGLQPRSQRKTVDLMKKSTNSGSPYYTKRKSVVHKTLPVELVYRGVDTEMWLDNDLWYAAAVLGWRGQEGGPTADDVKQRVVWMFPFGVNIRELQVYQPAIEIAQRHNLVPAWVSMEEVDKHITKLFDTKGKRDLIICTDFTKFDQHFNPCMQEGAKRIIQSLLNNSAESRSWLEDVFPVKYEIPLAYNMNKLRFGKHGMGSGSGGTNFDETIAHRALQYEAAHDAGSKLNIYSQCLGDDGILTYPGVTAEQVMQTYVSHGQDMNLEKQSESTHECTYLRRWHDQDYRMDGVCVGVYATARALGRLCEQERFYDPEVWGPKMVALRQLSILENCKYHPLRNEFVEYCMKGDKYRLGIDIPGFLDNIDKVAKEANDLMPDFLGYTKSLQKDAERGISNWWIVKLLKSMR